MASTTFFNSSRNGFGRRVLRALGTGMDRYIQRQSRSAQIRRLQSRSDAELARMGLRRNQIVAHVFRDRFYL